MTSNDADIPHGGDLALVNAALAGDEGAYMAIVEAHQPMVARLMWRFTTDSLKLEELVHDTFVQAYFSLGKYRGTGPLGGWIRTIGVRVGYRHWKEKAREKNRDELNDQIARDPGVIHALEADPEPASAAHQALHAALGQLPPRDRLVLTLLYWERCSTEEAAKLTGWSGSMVRVQAFRARKKLKKLLEKLEDGRG